MIKKIFLDKKFRVPRIWSNGELKKFAPLFSGDVVNVSGWTDVDKEGSHYKDYFRNASSYSISNFKSEARGFQGAKNEFFLNLEEDLESSYHKKFDIVFNHTTLEHIYEMRKAFANLCLMSNDVVILVVPFLQQMHSDYGDYWRFTPLAIKRLFEENDFDLLYLSFNSEKNASVYIFAIATRNKEKWSGKIGNKFSFSDEHIYLDNFENFVGCKAINNSLIYRLYSYFNKLLET